MILFHSGVDIALFILKNNFIILFWNLIDNFKGRNKFLKIFFKYANL